MTAQLRGMLCDHAAGILTTMSARLLFAARQRQAPVLDEELYFEVFADPRTTASKTRATATAPS